MFTVGSIINKLIKYNQNDISENGGERNSKICPFGNAMKKLTIVIIDFYQTQNKQKARGN